MTRPDPSSVGRMRTRSAAPNTTAGIIHGHLPPEAELLAYRRITPELDAFAIAYGLEPGTGPTEIYTAVLIESGELHRLELLPLEGQGPGDRASDRIAATLEHLQATFWTHGREGQPDSADTRLAPALTAAGRRKVTLANGQALHIRTGSADYRVQVDPEGHVDLAPPAPAPGRLISPATARELAQALLTAAELAEGSR